MVVELPSCAGVFDISNTVSIYKNSAPKGSNVAHYLRFMCRLAGELILFEEFSPDLTDACVKA